MKGVYNIQNKIKLEQNQTHRNTNEKGNDKERKIERKKYKLNVQ